MLDLLEPQSPLWWVKRLYKQIQDQCTYYRKMDGYYRGEPAKYPWLPDQARDEFARLLKLTKSNYMGLVVDTTAERLSVEGFRIGGETDADVDAWRIWQANNLDTGSDQGFLESLIGGQSYVLVAPNPKDDKTPLMYVEHMEQATVEYVPGTGRREVAAGLKVWIDDWTGQLLATLYLPDLIYKYKAPKPASGTGEPRWAPREVPGELWPSPNPVGEVSLFELPNNPRLLTGGVSEIDDVTAVQDRICKTLADRLMSQDFGAFPQKWATGFPNQDEQGNEVRINVGRDRMVTTDVAETRFGQWDAAGLDQFSAAKREDVKDIASRTRTPAQYLLGELNNVNGQTLKAAESGLVSKVKQRMKPLEDGLERSVACAKRLAGTSIDGQTIETIWRNPEMRTEGELVDALVKMSTLGVPQEALWERWGATQVEIERWKTMREEQATLDPVGQLTERLNQQPAEYQAPTD